MGGPTKDLDSPLHDHSGSSGADARKLLRHIEGHSPFSKVPVAKKSVMEAQVRVGPAFLRLSLLRAMQFEL